MQNRPGFINKLIIYNLNIVRMFMKIRNYDTINKPKWWLCHTPFTHCAHKIPISFPVCRNIYISFVTCEWISRFTHLCSLNTVLCKNIIFSSIFLEISKVYDVFFSLFVHYIFLYKQRSQFLPNYFYVL